MASLPDTYKQDKQLFNSSFRPKNLADRLKKHDIEFNEDICIKFRGDTTMWRILSDDKNGGFYMPTNNNENWCNVIFCPSMSMHWTYGFDTKEFNLCKILGDGTTVVEEKMTDFEELIQFCQRYKTPELFNHRHLPVVKFD